MVKAQDKNRQDATPYLHKNFHKFLNSLSDVLIDITALEVNTMVVEQITANKFIPWEAYRDIYLLSQAELENRQIHQSLHPLYLNLRRQLEMEYCAYFLADANSRLEASELREYYDRLADPSLEVDVQTTKLPNPLNSTVNPAAEIERIQTLLENGRFLRCLRKVSELKIALDNQNIALRKIEAAGSETQVITDIIYAQTIIQLDGNIINRYHQRLFDNEHKDMILDFHRQGVIAGEKQWHGLIKFMVNLVESLVGQSSWKKELLNRN